jgi:wobble nucleotide-excising tRNase
MTEAFIKRIDKVSNFGSFVDYKWDSELEDFQRYNLIYGWNGSGKTTLSKILRCFETKDKPSSYKDASITISDKSNNKIKDNLNIFDGKIKVFNRDYVSQNIIFDQGSLEPLVYIGEKQIEDKKELEKLEEELGVQEATYQASEIAKTNAEEAAENFSKNNAKVIKDTLNISYNKNNFDSDIAKITEGFEEKKLSDKDFQENKKILSSENDKDKQEEILIQLNGLSDFIDEILSITSSPPKKSINIEELDNNQELYKWVKQGQKLHEHRENCGYCTSKIAPSRKEILNQYYSKEDQDYISNVEAKKLQLTGLINNLEATAVDSARLFPQLKEEFNKAITALSQDKEQLKSLLKSIEEKLGKIEDNPRFVVNIQEIQGVKWNELEETYKNKVSEVNKIILKHNNIIINFDKTKQVAEEKLKAHLLVKCRDDREALILDIEKKKGLYDKDKAAYDKTKGQISEKQGKLSSTKAAADSINDLLKLMGHPHLSIKDSEQGYKLLRSGFPAIENLSDGERTAITFAHFIASLKDQDFSIKDSIIAIDDPISSLDSNVLYSVFAVTKAYTQDAKQLFLMTHHHGFYSLLLNWIKYEKKNTHKKYYVQRHFCKDTGQPLSNITTVDEFLNKYDSEYHYLFYMLYKFQRENQGAEISLEYVYPYLNIARKLLEIFFRFKYPNQDSMSVVFNKVETDYKQHSALVRKIRAIVMDGSHADINSVNGLPLTLLTPDNAKTICEVTDLIKIIDEDHYEKIKGICQQYITPAKKEVIAA